MRNYLQRVLDMDSVRELKMSHALQNGLEK
jgi:hypothetical protein